MEDLVATFIAPSPGAAPLPRILGEAHGVLAALGADVGATAILAPERAGDLPFRNLAADQADAALRRALGAAEIDIVVQPAAGRRKRLLVADMESTIIENEMLEELADFLGLREEVAEITRKAMNGEIDFVAALRSRVALLKNMPVARLAEAGERIRVMPGAAALVATMREAGAATALVSGGFTIYTRPIRDRLGFDFDVGNELLVAAGRLTGEVGDPIVTKETKLATLTRLAAERGLPLAATLAVGDGANDLPMLGAAGLGIAFRAKPAVASSARVRIDHGDLTSLLFAQGYRDREIVGG
jgi:phosphoserine phosphatase